MPTYEYECTKCRKKFEIQQKMADAPIETCPDTICSGEVKRLISKPGIQFKGSGWYVTDYSDKMKKETSTPPPCAADCPSGGCKKAD